MFQCPKCKSNLDGLELTNPKCTSCGREFVLIDNFVSFIEKENLDSHYECTQKDIDFLLQEGQTTRDRFNRYFVPLLEKSGLKKDCSILCLGCGGGEDVETIIASGYENTIGVDIGWRSDWWRKNNRDPEHFFIADGRELPFKDNNFDIVISLGVIEHVGAVGDTADLYPDFKSQRLEFIKEVCRILKAEGMAILACPNRLFPVDFQHNLSETKFFKKIGEKTGMSFHSPYNQMLLSYGDAAGYCRDIDKNYIVKPLPQLNYLGLNFRNSTF